jgi:hypothetical protein
MQHFAVAVWIVKILDSRGSSVAELTNKLILPGAIVG